MAAKDERVRRLIYILEHTSSRVSSTALARALGTSERTVRNYIAEINRSGRHHVESSKEGYRLKSTPSATQNRPATFEAFQDAPSAACEYSATCSTASRPNRIEAHTAPAAKNTPDARRDYVISKLINEHAPVSIFDVASALHVSESTLSNSVLPHVRKLIAPFNLALECHDFQLQLTGREHDKRRLLGSLAIRNASGYFTSTDTLKSLFPAFDVEGILNKLVEICQRSELIINNYALNNLLIHILVIIIRLQSNNELSEREDSTDVDALVASFSQGEAILKCANDVAHYFETEFGCPIPANDFQQIVLLIALSVERYSYDELTFDKLANLTGYPFMDHIINIAHETADRYGIARFDDAFMLQLVLHMYNVYQRAIYRVSYPNPLALQIKTDYAPVYDMAVYFAHRFSGAFDASISEDEIAFIAFHIGAYLERTATPDGKATAVVIVEQYHDFAQQLVTDLEEALSDELSVIAVMSCDAFLSSPPGADLVITTIDVPVRCGIKVLIGPILNKQNLRKIRDKLALVLESKRRGRAHRFLKQVLRRELYVRNMQLSGGPDAYIDYLGSLCKARGFVDDAFVRDVHLRERVSSTAFTDCLAIPHSIDSFAGNSLIAVLHNDAAIPWGRHNVNFVLLIGIAEGDMGYFRDTLDIIIELFSSVDATIRLLQTDSFDEFLEAFTGDL